MSIRPPHPDLDVLQEEYLLVAAWKKTAAFIRAHNWFADTLAIDRASVELPQFLRKLAGRLSDPDSFETHPLRLVPAPKSHPWIFTNTATGGKWEPEAHPEGARPRIRPLAHVDLGDQVAATAILLCLADRVETEQGHPVGSPADANHRGRVLSYGNRLLCDEDGRDLRHRWGSRVLYRGYFQDYRTFLARPIAAAEAESPNGSKIVIVQSDLRNFYDRVRPSLLARKIRSLRREGDSGIFFDLAERILNWQWDPLDEASADAYAERENITDFRNVALPQGLVAAGFFANVVLLGFDHRLRQAISEEIFPRARLVDAARYVDDLRIVIKLDPERVPADVTDSTTKWIRSMLTGDPGLEVSEGKTVVTEVGSRSERLIVRQSHRMSRIQKSVSGGFDVAGGEAILEAVRGLIQAQQRHPHQPADGQGWPLSPAADVPDATVARFAAGRFRRVYRWLRPLLEDPGAYSVSAVGAKGEVPALTGIAPERARAELDSDAEVFAAGLIQKWVEDPSNIRLLRIAFDIWPSASAARQVLNLLVPHIRNESGCEQSQIAQYCLAEMLRAGATETGLVNDKEVLSQDITEYRSALQEASEQMAGLGDVSVPWYLRQQALLFLAANNATHIGPFPADHEVALHAALLRFLSDPESATSAVDFATFSVLARRSFAPAAASERLLPHLNRPRLTKIAEADPALAIELVGHDPKLAGLLPEHVRRDLCLIRTLPGDSVSLAELVLKGDNPFRDELALLQFAVKALGILRKGQSGTVAPVDLEVTLHCSQPWEVREGNFDLKLHHRRRLQSSIYSPPAWCPDDQRWRLQLGYLLRFILTGAADFTAIVQPPHWKELLGNTYRPAPMPWRMRRYGFFNAHEAFGDRWLPITEWTTSLLLDLLAWPGVRTPSHPWIQDGIAHTLAAIRERIEEIVNTQGPGRSELLIETSVDSPVPMTRPRPLRAAVVQLVLPKNPFRPGHESLDLPARRKLRKHLAAALEAVRQSLRLRRTHGSGNGELDLLILPELSVHTDDLIILKEFARANGTIILAGLVYHEGRVGDGRPFVNSAVWLLPERTGSEVNAGRGVRIIEQGKHNLAAEEKGLNVRSFRTSQWLIGYQWSPNPQNSRLWLTASVCYDATDLALAADIRGRSDVYLIPANNKDVGTFDKMASALHYHMFQMVIVANNGRFGGSSAYAPYSGGHFKRQVFHLHGQPQAAIGFVEIDEIRKYLDRTNHTKRNNQFKHPPAGLAD